MDLSVCKFVSQKPELRAKLLTEQITIHSKLFCTSYPGFTGRDQQKCIEHLISFFHATHQEFLTICQIVNTSHKKLYLLPYSTGTKIKKNKISTLIQIQNFI